MSKSILVINDPKNCNGCPLFANPWVKGEVICYCRATFERLYGDDAEITKPSWCPLRPLPSKRKTPITKTFGTPFNKGKAKGWNACLEELEK